MNKENNSKVEFTVDANNIPVWNTDEGVIMGLAKADFLNEDTKAHNQEAKKAFYSYMIQFKTYRHNLVMEKATKLQEEVAMYTEKVANIGKTLSPKELAIQKLAKAKKAYEAQMKALEAMGLEADEEEEA